jgi:hypothetical protein
MMLVFGAAIIVLVVVAIKINRLNKNLGFPANRKIQGKRKGRKERNGKGSAAETGY